MAETVAIAAIKFVQGVAAYFKVSLTVAQAAAIINTATYTALSLGVNAYMSSQRQFPNQGRMLQLGIASDLPRRWQIGRRANAGYLVDWFTGGYNNQELSMVIYLGEGPMAPPDKIWADGRVVYSGALTHGVEQVLTEFDSPDARAWVTFHDGRSGQTVDSGLNSSYSVGANYRGAGCAYVVLRLKWDPDTTAAFPQFAFEGPGAHMYDRRLDSTAGGSGSARFDDPSTWSASDNPAVALDHYLLGRQWSGDAKPRMGVGLLDTEVPYSRFAALANLCEEQVSLGAGGTQDRYQVNGFIHADQLHKDVIIELCKAMNCRPADFGGQVSAISHAASASIMTITDDDVIGLVPEIYQPKRSWAELVGGAQGTYQDPANAYRPTEYPRVEDAAFATEDGGQAKTVEVSFPFEINAYRAQRLARLFVLRERRQATLTGAYMPRTIELEEGDWFTRDGDRFSNKVFEVVAPPQLDPNTMQVTISAVEVDPTDSAWSTSDEVTPDTTTGDPTTTPPVIQTPNVTFATVTYGFGNYSFTGIRYNHTEYADGLDVTIEIEIADDSTGSPDLTDVRTGTIAAGQQYSSMVGIVLPGQTYHTRVRARVGHRVSAWTSWTQFTALTNTQYGPVGITQATLGSNIYAEDGTTLLGDVDLITDQGIAAGFTGQGSLASLSSISSANANAWNLLRRTSGGLYTGDLAADITLDNIAAGFTGQGTLATLSSISSSNANAWNLLRRSSGGLFTGDLNADITSGNIAAGFTGQGALATLSTVGNAQIQTGAVDTNEIADNAVSNGDEDAAAPYDFTTIDNTFVTLCTLAPQNVGGVAILSWSISWVVSAFGGGTANTEIGTVDIEIRRDGVMIFEFSEPYTNRNTGTFGDSGGWTDSDFDLVVDTSAVYTLAARFTVTSAWSPGTPSIEGRSVTATLKATAFAK